MPLQRAASLLIPWVLAFVAQTGWAVDASDYLLLPTVNEGEREIDWRNGIASSGPTTNGQADSALGFGFAATSHWFTELAIHYTKRNGTPPAFKDVAWENILQLAEPGEWPVDAGVDFEIEHSSRSQDQLEITAGPLLQKEFGAIQANFNVLLSHVIEGSDAATNRLHFQWQVKYRYSEPFEFGVQGFDNLSSSNDTWAPYSDQVHRLGPVALGRLKFAHERSLSYNAALLFGTTANSPDYTLRFQLEYEF